MVKILAPLAFAGAALAARLQDPTWEAYKTKFGKSYELAEDTTRHATFANNMAIVKAHNERADAGKETYWMGQNDFSDQTTEEVNVRNGYGFKHSNPTQKVGVSQYPCPAPTPPTGALPVQTNWVSNGAVTVIKNQLTCGDCWAFSASGCMEGARKLQGDGVLQSLSVQQVTDCSSFDSASMGPYSNHGCDGGFPQNAFYYAYNVVAGIESYGTYPFVDKMTTCAYDANEVVASFNGCVDPTTSGDETALAYAVAQVGPVSVAIDAALNSFHNYAYGIYSASTCSSTELDHAVLATGYGVYPQINAAISTTCIEDDFYCTTTQEGYTFKYPCLVAPAAGSVATKDTTAVPGQTCNPPSNWAGQAFWMVKNSWGRNWGMEGYIMMSRNNNNNCGIATAPSYATV